VSLTLYKDTLSARPAEKSAIETPSKSKVNRICDLMIEHLRETKPESYWRNLVTAYVCKSPSDLESALRFIRELPGILFCFSSISTSTNVLSGDVTLTNATELKREAISLIVIIVDVNQLFDTAIGLYDLELAVTLAQEAQKVDHQTRIKAHDADEL
jgi:elongator complex protein 1